MSYPELLTADEQATDAEENTPHIIVICGSTRFADQMADIDRELTWAGNAVFAPTACNLKQPHPLWADPAERAAGAKRLADLHYGLIRLANEVVVVNPGGYVGPSTTAEVTYARSLGKPVRFTHPEVNPAAEGPVGCRRCGGTAGPFDLTTGLCEDCLGGAA